MEITKWGTLRVTYMDVLGAVKQCKLPCTTRDVHAVVNQKSKDMYGRKVRLHRVQECVRYLVDKGLVRSQKVKQPRPRSDGFDGNYWVHYIDLPHEREVND